MRIPIQRREVATPLLFGCPSRRSLDLGLLDCRSDRDVDILLPTETWHDPDTACTHSTTSRERSAEASLGTKHGSVVAEVHSVRLEAVDSVRAQATS